MSRVLLVDDDEGRRLTFESILRLESFQTATAPTGRAGLGIIERDYRELDCVLIDLRLPDISGLEVLVGAVAKRLPAVVYTAFEMEPESEIAARALGAIAFVDRMMDEHDLLRLVRTSLEQQPFATSDSGFRLEQTVSAEAAETGEAPRTMRPGHAAVRWAKIVVPVARLQSDVPTVAAWSREVGVSQSTLKRWCDLAHVNAGDSLDFARVLRVVCRHAGRRVDWLEELAIGTLKTVEHLLHRAGLRSPEPVPNLESFLDNQRLIASPVLIAAIHQALESPSHNG